MQTSSPERRWQVLPLPTILPLTIVPLDEESFSTQSWEMGPSSESSSTPFFRATMLKWCTETRGSLSRTLQLLCLPTVKAGCSPSSCARLSASSCDHGTSMVGA